MTPIRAKRTTLPMLTEMRGVAALLIYHMHLSSFVPALRVLDRAYLGVDFFFILSGFVLTHVYRDWFYPVFRPQSFRNFFWARFGRIYPLQFCTATLYALLFGLILGKWELASYLREVILLNFLPRWPALSMVSWSIGAECVAYLFAPLLIHSITSKKPWRIGVAFLLSALALYWAIILGSHSFNTHSIKRCLPEFIFGICCYEACQYWQISTRTATWLALGSVLSMFVSLFVVPVGIWGSFGCVLSFCVLIPAAVHLHGPFVRLFKFLFGHLGDISYSVYLIHPLVLLAVTPLLVSAGTGLGASPFAGTMIVYWGSTLLVILLASLSYWYLELPARSFVKRTVNQSVAKPVSGAEGGAEIPFMPAMKDSPRER
jgi:peptidoglycan/LPS O-acetylase OafA/YrhL